MLNTIICFICNYHNYQFSYLDKNKKRKKKSYYYYVKLSRASHGLLTSIYLIRRTRL